MAYSFDFDLSKKTRTIFKDIAKFTEKRELHSKAGDLAKKVADRLGVQKITGLPVSDALTVVQDLTDIYVKNLSQEDQFQEAKTEGKKALLLPHCSRKHMDDNCQASFDKETSSYSCAHCSQDCLVNQATKMGEKRGYDVYVLPGGSCIKKILDKKNYSAVVGVACPQEIKLGIKLLDKLKIPFQGVPLLRNGCSNTLFNLNTLGDIL